MTWQDAVAGRCLTQAELYRIWQLEGQGQIGWEDLCKLAKVLPTVTGPPWICGRCGNQDAGAFHHFLGLEGQGLTYCLDCLTMGRVMSNQHLFRFPVPACQPLADCPLTWCGQLTPQQDRVAQNLVAAWQAGERRPQLIWAVTGAGKTELVFPMVNQVVMEGGRVAFASPRVDVCLEIAPRLQAAFTPLALQLLHGQGNDHYHLSPLTVTTTHQLLRCYQAYDLVIVDEVDAFPFVNSRLLHQAVDQAVKPEGQIIYLTATPDDCLLEASAQGQLVCHRLPARYHGYPLPVPELRWVGDWVSKLAKGHLSRRLRQCLMAFGQLKGPKLLFLPQIRQAQVCAACLKPLLAGVRLTSVHASDPDRHRKVEALRQGELDLLVTTTILERGVTFPNCQVCILGSEDAVFNRASLVQMSGRVGRSVSYPQGHVWWLHHGISKNMRQALEQIHFLNQEAAREGLLRGGDPG